MKVKFLSVITLIAKGKFINRLDHFCSKERFRYKRTFKSNFRKRLIKQGWIENLNDLFTLRQIQYFWKQMPGFGEKSVEKILQSIEDSRETNLESALISNRNSAYW